MYDDVGYPEVLDVLGADVNLPALPVCTGIDGHPALLPLELVAQPDGHNLGHIEIRRRHGQYFFLPIYGHQFHLFPRREV